MSDLIITEKENIVAIADAVRSKIDSVAEMTLGQIVTNINNIGTGSGVNLDAEITAQENVISSQDTLIASIASALEGKATGGGVTPPTYNMWETTINYNVGSDGYIYIEYLATDDNGFIEWKQTENLTGEGTIIIESLSSAWLLVGCRQSFSGWTSQEYSLSIEQVNDVGESSYKAIYMYGDGAYGAIGSGLEFNISFTDGGWE